MALKKNVHRALCGFFVLSLLCCIFAATAQADFQRTKIAVLDFGMIGDKMEPAGIGAILSEWFTTSIVKSGRFDVVERAMLQKILAEQKLAATGVIDESTASELGKILGVKVIITGSILKLNNSIDINARIISVESGSIIAAESIRGKVNDDYYILVEKLTDKIMQNFPLTGYIVKREGQTALIDLGMNSGLASGTEFVVYKEGTVIKHPKTGEVLDVEQVPTGRLRITKIRKNVAVGTILNEEGDGIEYGQLVKSVQSGGAMEPMKRQQQPQAPPPPSVVQTPPPQAVPPTSMQVAEPVVVLKNAQAKKRFATTAPPAAEQPGMSGSPAAAEAKPAEMQQKPAGPKNHVAIFPINFRMRGDVIKGFLAGGLPDAVREALEKLDRSRTFTLTNLIKEKNLQGVSWEKYQPNVAGVVAEAQKRGFDYVLLYYCAFWEGQGLINGWGTDFFSPTFKVFLVDVQNKTLTEREDTNIKMQDQLLLELKSMSRQLLEATEFPN